MNIEFNYNPVSGALFSDANQSHLEAHKKLFDLKSNEWAGYKQWQEAGRVVTGGKGCGCKIYIICDKKFKNSEGEYEKKRVPKGVTVFNIEHTEEAD